MVSAAFLYLFVKKLFRRLPPNEDCIILIKSGDRDFQQCFWCENFASYWLTELFILYGRLKFCPDCHLKINMWKQKTHPEGVPLLFCMGTSDIREIIETSLEEIEN
jgi:hypothetical protein